jgi:hypothetical protein
MIEEFVPYELASKLKQLGFDEPCFGIWKDGKLISVGGHWGAGITHSMFGFEGDRFAPDECRAPLFSQAFRWFRENHGVMHRITSYAFGYEMHIDNTPSINIKYVDRRYDPGIDYKTYEEAELACLEKLIEIVETEQ